MSRKYQIVIFGASGYGGRLAAEYFVTNYLGSGKSTVKFAIAGRNKKKLEELISDLKEIDPAAADLDILIGDGANEADMEMLAEQTDVVASTAGPYRLYGSALVAACAKKGTSYVDLSGEAAWIQLMESTHHATAKQTGARVVPGCGFDSIPSDLGTFLAVKKYREMFGTAPERIDNFVLGFKGGFQGGTINTILNEIRDPLQISKEMRNGSGEEVKGKTKTVMTKGLWYSSVAKRWTAPFLMAGANMPLVKRTNKFLGYSENMIYRECFAGSFLSALMNTVGMSFGVLMLLLPPTRWLMERFVLPKSGDGPSRETMLAGNYKMKFVASGGDKSCSLILKARGDPGALQTTILMSESAVCLALEKNTLTSGGGVLTPMSAMGDALWDRLKEARWSRSEEAPRIVVENSDEHGFA